MFTITLCACVVPKQTAINIETQRTRRFILATNVVDSSQLSDDDVLREYKAQQSTERSFRFLKDPLFFTSSVFLNSTERVAALAMVMGLCLLVYSLGQTALRQALERAKKTIDNQLGKPTSTPTWRWVFQCFMSIHLVTLDQIKQIANLTPERQWILQFFGAPCRKYYLLSLLPAECEVKSPNCYQLGLFIVIQRYQLNYSSIAFLFIYSA